MSQVVLPHHDGPVVVPIEPPPAYEVKPDDTDDEQHDDSSNGQFTKRTLKWKKFLISFALIVLSFWFTFGLLRAFGARRPGVVYSSSYSNDHRFRPAASPVITETLADGRTRIRGAHPTVRE